MRPTDERKDFRAYFEANGKAQLDPLWSITGSLPRGDRQDRDPPLRPHPRRPAAQRHQRRADQPQCLRHHRRLGIPGPARRPTTRNTSRSRFRRSTPASGSAIRSSAARSSFRPTACRSSASKARTRSAPSPARAGTCGASRPGDRSWCSPPTAAATSITPTNSASTDVADLSRHRRLARARDRRARGGRQMAVRRARVRRIPAARAPGRSWC